MHKPYLIQRCNLDNGKLGYQYMGMSEFECGSQAKSLKRIFLQGIVTQKFSIDVESESVEIFLVAGKDFNFAEYELFLGVLANEDWHRPEPTYLNSSIKKQLGREVEECYSNTNVWFDFENDVLLALSQDDRNEIVEVLNGIKLQWETSNPPALKKFKEDLEVVKGKLKKAGKEWYSLSRVREIEGEYYVWLNPVEQRIHNYGWFTLDDLLAWSEGRGCVMRMKSYQ